MATVCDYCGYRSNEVKSGTGVSPKGTKITLRVTDQSDLSRDILKVHWTMGGGGGKGKRWGMEGVCERL